MNRFGIFVVLLGLLLPVHTRMAFAQAPLRVGELSTAEKKAVEQIDLKRVTSTITFLASDELGGRGTGSPEYRIAAAYVASRFRGSGLIGGGKNQSYFQVAEIASSQLPSSGIVFSGKDAPAHFGLLYAGNQDVAFQGKLAQGDPDGGNEYSGPVYLDVNQAYEGPRGFATLVRDANRMRRKGATAILVKAAADSELVGIARQNQKQSQIGRSRLSIPILLIEDKAIGEHEYKIAIPKRIDGKTKYRNVIGILKGSDPELSKQAVIISAHLDHLGTRLGMEDPVYNGADDNASGVTGVVTLADAFGSLETAPKRTMIFIAFGGEEMGLQGSRFFADHPLWPLKNIVAMINLEMIGRPESGARNKAWGTGWDQSNLGELMAIGAKRVGTLIFQHPEFSGRMLYGASDNWPLVQKGVIAHSFSAGSLHSDYHQPSDHWEKLEIDHMTAVIRGLFAGSLPIAEGELTPKKSK